MRRNESRHHINDWFANGEPSIGAPYGIIDPDYARVFTIARLVGWQYGYAIAMHGSFTRDLDLIAVPWTDKAVDPDRLIERICAKADLRDLGAPSIRPFGRMTWTLMFKGFGDPRFIDLSVTPKARVPKNIPLTGSGDE